MLLLSIRNTPEMDLSLLDSVHEKMITDRIKKKTEFLMINCFLFGNNWNRNINQDIKKQCKDKCNPLGIDR